MKDIVQKKLDDYQSKTAEDEENAIREITQEVALFALAKSDFFKYAAFQGGTCLRIMYDLDRFSEDLDFVLQEPNKEFDIAPFLNKTANVMASFGYDIKVADKRNNNNYVQKRFLKDDSIKKILSFNHYSQLNKKIKIKVELDINPPAYSINEMAFCDFPIDFSAVAQNIPSLFSGKCHALLCRKYVKGRDWYDFLWYIAKGAKVNYELLSAALNQMGNWQGENITVDYTWLQDNLANRIKEIDWQEATNDIRRFLRPEKIETLTLWGSEFFLQKLTKLRKN